MTKKLYVAERVVTDEGLQLPSKLRGTTAMDPGEALRHSENVDAFEKRRGREAGLLLRNHVETTLEFLKKSEIDVGFHGELLSDLEDAKEVHQAFLPEENLSIPGLARKSFYRPARCIGGDYYDFLALPAGRWGIAIGDVCGKGIGAALLMASLQASVKAQALHPHLNLTALIADVNRLVYESSPTAFFASLFYAEYEPASRMLQYVNAGHNPPIIVRPRTQCCELFLLRAEAVPIGIYAEAQYKATELQLAKEDILVAYTDGITEAANASGQLWGVERLESLLRSCSLMAPGQIVERILAEVSDFANGEPQRDDVTLVVIKVQQACDI